MNLLPKADRIQGIAYVPSPLRDPKADLVRLQYTDRTEQNWYQLEIPLLEALHLLNALHSMATEQNFAELAKLAPGRST